MTYPNLLTAGLAFMKNAFWQESEHGGMYSEWASLSNAVTSGTSVDSTSVLLKFPSSSGRDVALSVVRQLAANLGIAQAAEPSSLTTDKEVLWCMEVSKREVYIIRILVS